MDGTGRCMRLRRNDIHKPMTTFEHWCHLMVVTFIVILHWIGMAVGFVVIPILMGFRDAEVRLDRYLDTVEDKVRQVFKP